MLSGRFKHVILSCLTCLLLAQETLNNEGIIKLVKSGMTEDLIINVVQQQPGTYSFGANDLVALKEANVSEKIIAAMLDKGKQGAARPVASPVPAKAGATGAQNSPPSRSGIYYKKGGEYLELLTEEVEWSTSGAIKSIASAGIVKKDLNGSVAGPSSRNFLTNPMEIVLSPPGGFTLTSYILLPLKPNKGVREFNVGPVNKKSGVAKGAIPFGVEKVGENAYRMVLQTPLAPGEYGILAAMPSDSSTERSKMHTFRILL
jgi:hypothetical protein